MLITSVVLRHDCPMYPFSVRLLLTCLALNSSERPFSREFNFGTDHTGFFLSSLYKDFDPTTICIFLTEILCCCRVLWQTFVVRLSCCLLTVHCTFCGTSSHLLWAWGDQTCIKACKMDVVGLSEMYLYCEASCDYRPSKWNVLQFYLPLGKM